MFLFFGCKTFAVGVYLFDGLMKTRPSGKAFVEESLFHAGLAKALGSIDRIAPKYPDHVIGLEGGLDVFGISLSRGYGIADRFPTADVFFAILETNSEVADQNGFLGELVDFVEFFLRKFTMKRGLDSDGVYIGQHFFHHVGIDGIEAKTVTEDQLVGGMFALSFSKDAEISLGDEAEEGLIARFAAIAFPSLEESLVGLLTGCVLWQLADEIDPIFSRWVFQGP